MSIEGNAAHLVQTKDSFVVVLVDGDGAKFRDEFLRDPEKGGEEAATTLRKSIQEYMKKTSPHADETLVIARIFASFTDLGRSLRTEGVVNAENDISIFAEHFTNACAEFDFVNVGKGKENADYKVRKMLSYFLRNFQCRKIFFVGCHDAGYIHDLREHTRDVEAENRIVLVETTPAEPGFATLDLPIERFERVFRSTPFANETKRHSVSTSVRSEITSIFPTTPKSHHAPQMTRTYANVGGSHHVDIDLNKPDEQKPKSIRCNREFQRIDPTIREHRGVGDGLTYKKKKDSIHPRPFCNGFYLAGKCNKTDCAMEHNIELTPGEIAVHRFKARTGLCSSGPACRSYDCMLSHHCPFGQTCGKGACKFKASRWGDLHYSAAQLQIVQVLTNSEVETGLTM
ncbi:hypothetical protein P175DRAFT_0431682 [Aspergillus ochraceoroseus IBT 24754]|nr:uncharacterized protein P175DRAFT_0431682 [Aspergillus ochraceoroseus IBT 24754]PTU23547.1 hypothetical protein P175DRAFT_0431682 [Aspergillus ochraceoroseus IBT 24754]